MESPMGHANLEVQIPEEEPQEPTGEGAVLVAVNGAAAAVETTVRIAKVTLHCPVCTVGHLACGVCHLQLTGSGAGRCYVCGHDSGYARISSAMEDIVNSAKPPRCYARTTRPGAATTLPTRLLRRHDVAEHQRACPASARSPTAASPAGSPATLRDHLSTAHEWPVDGIRYSAAL